MSGAIRNKGPNEERRPGDGDGSVYERGDFNHPKYHPHIHPSTHPNIHPSTQAFGRKHYMRVGVVLQQGKNQWDGDQWGWGLGGWRWYHMYSH